MSVEPLKLGRGRPRKVIIPREFQILGHKGKVLRTDQAGFKKVMEECNEKYEEKLLGYYNPDNHTIYLDAKLEGTELEQTYLHELEHCILLSMGRDEIGGDESFVDLHAELLYQILKTKRGRLN